MAFRADEAASRGFDRARNYLIPRNASSAERERADDFLRKVVETCGPVVEAYPSWHPLLAHQNRHYPSRIPDETCGYRGLDHTIYFAHGFITCPYGDGVDAINSIKHVNKSSFADIEIDEPSITLYNNGTHTIFVRCEWPRPLESGHLIPKSLAVPLMLEQEVPVWRWAQFAESWENMRPYLLGSPHGNRSSLFVGQDTALSMKKIYISLAESGMFGALR